MKKMTNSNKQGRGRLSQGAEVVIEGLSFGYHSDHTAIEDISLSIKPGERFGIIGPTGAGKSTLLLHLNGILRGRGEVRIGGIKLEDKTLPKIRRRVGIVFQNPDDQLFTPTVEEDVAFGPLNFGHSTEETDGFVKDALAAFNLQGFEKLSPHHLSQGERKRVALATVMAIKPEVVALDEPFANLDPAMVQHLIELIKVLPATVILVSQSIIPALASCGRLAVMNRGRIVKVGPTKEIATDTKLLRSCGLDYTFYCDICKKFRS
jgi:energy-coupling factor transporter ATP-binding protein EcfA2